MKPEKNNNKIELLKMAHGDVCVEHWNKEIARVLLRNGKSLKKPAINSKSFRINI